MKILASFAKNFGIGFNQIVGQRIIRYNYSTTSSEVSTSPKRICIVGAGPAGFYAAQYILKHLPNSFVDIVERLPVPFGLVRFGVAPDHPEVKNVINTFTKVAENVRLRYLGNLSLGQDFTLRSLRERYNAVLLTYGANQDNKMNILGENSEKVLSAREFVAWYNGLPGAEKLNPNLTCESVAIVGQGNVAIDVARILLSSIDELKKTDITQYALGALSESKVKRVYLIGRRGPLQVAFTIKELREILKLPSCQTCWRREDFIGVENVISNLSRPRKRLTELMLQSLKSQKTVNDPNKKQFLPLFLRSPKEVTDKGIELTVNKLENDKAEATTLTENINCQLILRSIGYKSVNLDPDLNFDEAKGHARNIYGRVIKPNTDSEIDRGLYVAGWLATGPSGVILTTMNNSFSVANILVEDLKSDKFRNEEVKPGLDIKDYDHVVFWNGWKRIDGFEIAQGEKHGKLREKLVDINKMLAIAMK